MLLCSSPDIKDRVLQWSERQRIEMPRMRGSSCSVLISSAFASELVQREKRGKSFEKQQPEDQLTFNFWIIYDIYYDRLHFIVHFAKLFFPFSSHIHLLFMLLHSICRPFVLMDILIVILSVQLLSILPLFPPENATWIVKKAEWRAEMKAKLSGRSSLNGWEEEGKNSEMNRKFHFPCSGEQIQHKITENMFLVSAPFSHIPLPNYWFF